MSASVNFTVTKKYDCDVLVTGGGVAGLSAAVCAAREGAKVILCERDGCLGGTATVGLVGPFMSSYDPEGKEQVLKGFMDEFIRRMEKKGGAIHPSDCPGGNSYSAYRIRGHIGVTPFDPECFKETAEEFCEEAGVKVLYHMLFCGCDCKNGTIRSAYFMTKNGVYEIAAKTYVDATGDADVAESAGAPLLYGDENGRTQVASIFFLIDGVDRDKVTAFEAKHPENTDQRGRYLEDVVEEYRKAGKFPCGRSRVSAFEALNGIWRVNMTQYDGEAFLVDPEDVTKAEMACRKQIRPLMEFLRENVPGFENIRLLQSANSLGIRESRRIVGDYTLTMDDMAAGRSFEDGICTVGSAVDFHSSSKADGSYDGAYGLCGKKSAQIPYRSLIPQKVDNLLAAGRCLSADQMAHSAVRVMPPCFAMGQAAGVAAAMAAEGQCGVRDIDVAELRKKLISGDVILETSGS